MIIRVTKQDIKNGKRGKCRTCPIALAVARKTDSFARVTGDEISIFDTKHARKSTKRWSTPCEVQEFVINFDSGADVIPFSFELSNDDLIVQEWD